MYWQNKLFSYNPKPVIESFLRIKTALFEINLLRHTAVNAVKP